MNNSFQLPNWLLAMAAAAQIFTAIIYPYVRRNVLNWYNDIRKLSPLNQAIAKTYGWYIQGLNFLFGLFCLLLSNELQNGSGLALAFSGLLAVYWTGRVVIQFAGYPMHTIAQQPLFQLGKILMNTLIIFLALVFLALFTGNLVIALNS